MPEFPISNYRPLMLPVLQSLGEGADITLTEVRSRVASSLDLTKGQMMETYEGGQSKLNTQVQFALLNIERAGLVRRVSRGIYRLTPEGRNLLERKPTLVDDNLLRSYPSWVEWQARVRDRRQSRSPRPSPSNQGSVLEATPEEMLESASQELQARLEVELLDRILEQTPEFLEQLILRLLAAMGYGGGDAEWGVVIGGSGDGGLDGMIKEDALGLAKIYVQAKKYSRENRVQPRDVREFAGALDATGTDKGVFVTTSSFPPSAEEYVSQSRKRIVLIDGQELARLMVEYDVGVRTYTNVEIKRIDEDFFESEGLSPT